MSDYNKLVIFDCDGTLVDGQHLIIDAMDLCFERQGLTPPERSASRSIIGLSLEEAMAVLIPNHDARFYRHMAEEYKNAFLDLRAENGDPIEPLYEGTLETLRELDAAGYLLAVATGKSMRGLKRVLASHEISNLFVSLQTADTHPSKPHPSMIQTAIMEAGSHTDQTIMVGDTSYDMLMAKSASVGAVGVNWGYHDEAFLHENGANTVLSLYSDLPKTVKSMIG
ncbi:HAD-IA family hydrolase [Kordiimonas sp. SCSIO 12610]|uniref:HAD-IA family hydrolase n=1 Tax=Kordiimonas sp. SCSIO 12610 TaxID=2829597 RepID=UPI00210B7580|nr:HAD-IA family hydrolase [Kordiimonas sp. SCSIO 12610]UTW54295.1 HAD-IA family hydrolase [Kordiimonas sp. SCSIO 12610]